MPSDKLLFTPGPLTTSATVKSGFIIYSGKLTTEPCFRIGTIGRLAPGEIAALLHAIEHVLQEVGIALRPIANQSR